LTVQEQRKSRRFDLRLPLELLRNGAKELLGSGETRNLSSSGVLFSTAARLEPGDVVEYLITLPTSPRNLEVRLRCKGKVVRHVPHTERAAEAAATLDRWEFVRGPSPRPF
jgi:hypothetical protein